MQIAADSLFTLKILELGELMERIKFGSVRLFTHSLAAAAAHSQHGSALLRQRRRTRSAAAHSRDSGGTLARRQHSLAAATAYSQWRHTLMVAAAACLCVTPAVSGNAVVPVPN